MNENNNEINNQIAKEFKDTVTSSNTSVFEMNSDEDLLNTTTENNNTTDEKPYKVRMIRASSKVSTCLNDVWYAFDFSETREITDDSKISEIRADLWNTVNSEVDNQVQYTIDSIVGKVPQPQPNSGSSNQQMMSNIPEQYDY